MPIYDYRCDHCGHSFSAVQSFKDQQLEKCPKCGKRPRRLIAAPAIVFKGSGWYKTDSRPSDKSDAKSETKSESKPDAKPGAKSDVKPPDKSSPKSEATS
ncbi:MAG TPA: FmdB family zinc ribbon protein [Candidatus Limnocylindria bacterium]|nr:FmdB family zinc ribbon protein [Candidatus Limnocylindria bacterium]